jgi:hypothetical protein
MPTGGDILEITYNHPTIGSGVLYPKSSEDSTFDLGGFKGNDDANSIDGGGRNIRQLNRTRWMFEQVVSWDMNTDNEMEKLKLLAASPEEADYTISSINGTVWSGKGAPVGDQNGNGNTSTITFKVAGGGNLKKII